MVRFRVRKRGKVGDESNLECGADEFEPLGGEATVRRAARQWRIQRV